MKLLAIVCMFTALTAVSDAAAQSCPPPRSAPAADTTKADILLSARVTAESLRFDGAPVLRANVTGCPQLDTTRVSVRTNMPRPVQSGVTYRNVLVDVRLRAQFADIDCLLQDVLRGAPADSAQRGASRACLQRDTIR